MVVAIKVLRVAISSLCSVMPLLLHWGDIRQINARAAQAMRPRALLRTRDREFSSVCRGSGSDEGSMKA
jgi:hypothetical protein